MTQRVLLIVSGGIAAYKALELVRLLRKRGIAVRAVLTESAKQFVTPLSLGVLTEDQVFDDLFDLKAEREIGHIQLSRQADLLVVAPATANILARMAQGLADDMATTLLLATDKPILVAPAMNVRMWVHPATQRNVEQLKQDGAQYRKAYRRDAQYIFSRVQHHVHRKTKDGYVPLHNCAKKGKKKGKSTVCKHDFPMKLCKNGPYPVCRGIAKMQGLRVAGRRNALGKIIGRRRCMWQSGTTPAFAVLFRSNSHTAPNYRLPLIPEVHNDAA